MAASSIVVNTNSFCEEDLTTFLECSERIQKCEERQRSEWLKKAILTNQEIFETSNSAVTDDDLIKQNAGEQSFLSKSASMENLLKYFEEEVKVDSDQDMKKLERNNQPQTEDLSPNTGAIKKIKTPLKDHRTSNIKPSDIKSIRWQSSAPSGSYNKVQNSPLDPMRKFVKLSDLDLIDQHSNKENCPKQTNSKPSEIPKQEDYGLKSNVFRSNVNRKGSRANHEYLKPSDLNLTMKEWEERYFKIIRKDLKPQDLNLTQQEWDERYYQIIRNDNKPADPIPSPRVKSPQEKPMQLDNKPSKWEKPLRPPKKSVKSKVQKIAEMFNGMITQVMKSEPSVGSYERFSNDLSPEAVFKQPQPKVRTKFSQPQHHVATPRSSPKPTPRPSPRLSKRPINPTGCLVPEEVFTKLSVKDKALLFNKFMREMSRQNPDFTIDPEEFKSTIEDKQKTETVERKVLTEKQESVMNLARELESKMIFPKQTISPAALGKTSQTPSKKRPAPQPPVPENQKEVEDESVHVSKLTVVLKPSPNKSVATSKGPVLRRKITHPTVVVCPSMKRTNHQISSAIPIEIYAPPRKIRRTRPERSNLKKFSQSGNIEQLFYDWMKDRHGLSFDIQNQTPNTSQEDKIQEENNTSVNIGEAEDNDKTIETDTTLKNDEVETDLEAAKKEETLNKPSEMVAKSDPSESDSSLLTMPSSKVNTDESQTDQAKESPDADFEFAKPVRPPRKKKVKRATLTWKKDNSIVEKLPLSTTDSDSDFKQLGPQNQQKSKKPTTLIIEPSSKGKKLVFKDSPSQSAQNSFEVDDAFLDFMNSPRKIRNAYTLTVMSSPSQKTDSILSNKSEAPAKPPRKGKVVAQLPHDINESKFENEDQGFETGSASGYSPARITHKTCATFSVSPAQEKSPLFIKLNAEMERRMSETSQSPSAYSTPVKGNLKTSENKTNPAKKQSWHTVFSPIQTSGGRRRSLADSDGRRSSIVMDVIREEQQQQSKTPESPTDADDDVFLSSSSNEICQDKKSSFWISMDDLTLSLDIFGNPKDRLSLLSDIFGQKSGESKNVHFGIDDLKYSPKKGAVSEEIRKNLPKIENISYYWFASGDLAVPFQGNLIAPERVKEIFNFIRNSSSSNEQISFGVDDIEFSKIPEPTSPGPKFSIESNYSMLIGLNGKSNETRNKFTWPNSSRNSTPFKTSDFDPSEFDSDSFEVSEIGRLSFSPYGSNYFDMASMQSSDRTSIASYASMGSPEMFTSEYESESLDKLFANKKTTTTSPTNSETFVFGKNEKPIKMPKLLPPTDSMTVDKMIETIRRQQHKLQNIETDMKTYTNPAGFTSSVLDKYHGRPYVRKLHNIVRSIQIIAKTGFENCTAQQLESFLYFLSLYAETCLSSCSNQMNVILEQLRKDKGVQV